MQSKLGDIIRRTLGLKKKPLEGSKVKGKAEYKSGPHSVTGEVNYRPGKGKGSALATYKYKFKKGGQI